jgi:hypothetical protein
MKSYKECLLATLGMMLMLVSCKNKEEDVVGTPEQVLPGVWQIESVKLTDYEKGVTFQGSTFFNDTTLFNVGRIQINTFALDTLEAIDLENYSVECLLEISSGQMEVSLNSLFMGGAEWWAAIRYNGPSGYQLIDTTVEEFYYSSHIFNNSYTVVIEDNYNMQLLTFNDEENHIITLVRN